MTKEELLTKVLSCNRCGSCRGVPQDKVLHPSFSLQCPSAMTFFGAYEPAGLLYLARGLSLGTLAWSRDVARILYSCTLCGYCEDLCNRGYRHTPAIEILEELRRIIPSDLKPSPLKKITRHQRSRHPHQLGILKGYGLKDLSEGGSAETILFPDTSLLHSVSKLHEIGFLIQRSGKKVGFFGAPPLPPVEALWIFAGEQEALEEHLEEIDTRLQQKEVKRVLCYNPESLSVLKRFSNSRVEFISLTSLYAEMLKKKPHHKLKMAAVTYQDPCHLGRYAEDYISPREVISRLGLTLKEMWRNRHNALCCGAGGGLLHYQSALAKRYAAHRWEEAKATGAQVMLTACPHCHVNLKRGTPRDWMVKDITSVVAQAYGYKGKAVAK